MSGGLVFDPLCAWCGGGGRVRAPWPNIGLSCHCGKRPKDTSTAPEPAAAPFCTRCDGYGVVLPVGSSIVVTCPACNGKTADRPERGPKAAPAAAPQVDTEDARRLADDGLEPFDLRRCIRRLADELDAHRAMRAELVALVADLRNEATAAPKATTRVAMWKYHDRLACILGEQP